MASSTQLSIREMMVATVAVAIVCAAVAPLLRQLEPDRWPGAIIYLSLLGAIAGAVVMRSWRRRRRVESKAGKLLLRSEVGGKSLRGTNLALAILQITMATWITIVLAMMDTTGGDPLGIVFLLRSFVILAALPAAVWAAQLFLHSWWGTGYLATEAFENGIVVRGLVFLPWSKLVSYQPTGAFIVNVSGHRKPRPVRLCVAAKDRADWERILAENGVPPTNSLVDEVPSTV